MGESRTRKHRYRLLAERGVDVTSNSLKCIMVDVNRLRCVNWIVYDRIDPYTSTVVAREEVK